MLAIVFILLSLVTSAAAAETVFAVARSATPVLNTADFKSIFGGKDGRTLRQDDCGQLRSLEFVAMAGTVFTIETELHNGTRKIYRVTTADYPYPAKSGYFIDAGFVTTVKNRPAERAATLPAREAIITALRQREGSRYVWGGNISRGLPEILAAYPLPEKNPVSRADKDVWQLAGVDCSGLLYEATGGYTPRNTGSLVNFGRGVNISGKSLKNIVSSLEPLDLIVWPGHVLIVIDRNSVIESRLVCREPERGVRIRPLEHALSDIMQRRKPVETITSPAKEFVVRRWYRAGE